jgi:hypothetical protein
VYVRPCEIGADIVRDITQGLDQFCYHARYQVYVLLYSINQLSLIVLSFLAPWYSGVELHSYKNYIKYYKRKYYIKKLIVSIVPTAHLTCL